MPQLDHQDRMTSQLPTTKNRPLKTSTNCRPFQMLWVSPKTSSDLALGVNVTSTAAKGPGSTLFPAGAPPGTPEEIAASLSPLQRMASITNSLVSQPNMTGGGHGNRPLRAVLPPITQQQFDQFSHLNTDETVRRVSGQLFFILRTFSIEKKNFCRSKKFCLNIL